jgi:hypothetical protein
MSEPVVYEIVNPDICHCHRCQAVSANYTEHGIAIPNDIHGVSHHSLIEVMEDHRPGKCFLCSATSEEVFDESYSFTTKLNYKTYKVGPREGKKPAWL